MNPDTGGIQMNKQLRKICLAGDYETIENWLNKQCDAGLAMVSFNDFGRCGFEECKPSEYTYRIYFMKDEKNTEENKRFLAFLEETGAERVATSGRWVFLRRKRELGEFQIFSDLDGKITHLKQISAANSTIMLLCLINTIYIPTWISDWNSERNFWQTLELALLGISFLCYIPCFIVWIKDILKIKKLQKEQQIYE